MCIVKVICIYINIIVFIIIGNLSPNPLCITIKLEDKLVYLVKIKDVKYTNFYAFSTNNPKL